MATGKGSGARDAMYGRRGGGWVDQGYDPQAEKDLVGGPVTAAKEAARKAQMAAELAEHARTHPDVIPRFLQHLGHDRAGTPIIRSGQDYPGRARMAAARLAAHDLAETRVRAAATPAARAMAIAARTNVELDTDDLEALRRHQLEAAS